MKRLVAKDPRFGWFVRDTDGRDYPFSTFKVAITNATNCWSLDGFGSLPCERMSDRA